MIDPHLKFKLTGLRKFFFLRKFILKTKLSAQQVRETITNNTDSLDRYRVEFFPAHANICESKVSGNSFELSKAGSYRTSLLVFAKGTIDEQNLGTQIKLIVRPSLSAILFHSIWVGFITVASLIVLWLGLTKQSKALLFLPVPATMLFFARRDVSFRRESDELKNYLAALFENEIIEL